MAGRRRPQNENDGFIDISGPPRKRQRRFPQVVTQSMHEAAQIEWELRQREQAEAQAEALAQLRCDEEAERKAEATFRLSQVLGAMKTAGYRTLHEFLAELLAAKDQHQSSQVSQMLINHGHGLLDLIWLRQPDMVAQWISKAAGSILAEEGANLAQLLRPPQHQSAMDDEEFPSSIDPSDFVAMATEALMAMDELDLP